MSSSSVTSTRALMRRMGMMAMRNNHRYTQSSTIVVPMVNTISSGSTSSLTPTASTVRYHSTNPQLDTNTIEYTEMPSSLMYQQMERQQRRPGPEGQLFESKLQSQNSIGVNLVGQSASIRRVFSHASNAQAYLTCGGQELASHASFDPNYDQAKQWIRARPIGPAIISPVLIQGLVGTLVDAALPQTIPISNSFETCRPLIVGTEVCATVTVTDVVEQQHQPDFNEEAGYELQLTTQVVRVQDDAVIATGHHTVWMPSYLKM